MTKDNIKPMWRFEQTADPTVLNLYIYGDVEGDYYDWWNGVTVQSETSATFFRDELAKNPNATTINIFINSYGGSVFEGTAIYNQLKRHPAKKVVHVDGFACSIASVIAMAGDTVVMPPNTMMMVHDMWMRVAGNARELRKAADDLDAINAAGRGAYLAKSGGKLTEDALAAMMESETWLTAQQCLDLGLCDQIGEQDADLTGAQKQLAEANQRLEKDLERRQNIVALLRGLTKPEPEGDPPPEPKQQKPEQTLSIHWRRFSMSKNRRETHNDKSGYHSHELCRTDESRH